jgi:GNAT superfamily N-acetyltransferase
MNQPPKLWIVAERPVRLPNALVAAESLRDRFPGGIHFVRDQSDAWQRVQWQPYSCHFDDVHTFARVKSCRGLLDLPRLYRDTMERKRAVAALPIEPDTDLLLCIAGVIGLASVAASAHPKVRKVLSISVASYERLTRAPDRTPFRFTTSGWLQNRVVEPLAGVERTLNLTPRLDPGGDGTRLVRLQKNPDEIFDTIVIASINGRELPASGNARFVAARYPSDIVSGRQAIIQNVFTEPEWRRRGLAALLIKRIIDWTRQEGIYSLVLHASDEGRALYERLGFIATTEMRFNR